MRIWIDLANSPQVLFFTPVVAHLRDRGHDVAITTRAFAQTTQLATQRGLEHMVIGEHGGVTLGGIARTLLARAWQLRRYALAQRFDLALSHNSYAQIVAAKLIGVPSITFMDYEHQPANHVSFRLATRVVVPECFPVDAVRRFGAAAKVRTYPGVKEQIYLSDFRRRSSPVKELGLSHDDIIVTARPPGTWGLYSGFENPLFMQVIHYILANPRVHVVMLPRIKSQEAEIRSLGLPRVHVPMRVVDGPSLIAESDLVISGGGTMNREAAVLGTAAYSVFKGRPAAVDRMLSAQGRLTFIESPTQLNVVRLEKAARMPLMPNNLMPHVMRHIDA